MTKLLNPAALRRGTKTLRDAAAQAEVGRLLQQGLALQMKGQLWPAHECYRAILDRDPDQPDALHLMALIALETMRADSALPMLKRAVARKPGDPALRGSYAEALMLDNDPVAAERQLNRALKLDPNQPELLCKLARCHSLLGREDEARRLFKDVLAREPNRPSALLGYADLLLRLGERHEAAALYRRALEQGISPAQALAGLAECRTYEGDPPEVRDIKGQLGKPGLMVSDAIRLSQAAAKISADIGRYDDQFEYYVAAKAMLGSEHDRSDAVRRFQSVKALFTPDFFAKRNGYGDPSSRPVFIVGMPRSGTTLTEQIIASHPQAYGAGEIGVPHRIAVSLGYGAPEPREFARRVGALSSKEAKGLARDGLAVLDRFSTSAARITDKMPHNFEVLGLLALLFPKAKVIHCRRNPLDTCISCFLTPLREQHGYAQDLTALGEYYREYASLMEHWRAVLPMPMLEVEYEALVGDLEGQSRRLIDFIGLEWDPACLDFHNSDRAVHTISRSQVRQPVYTSSIGRWRRYERHIGPLRAALGDLGT